MQAGKERRGGKAPPAEDNRRSNVDPAKKRRKIEPAEGSQTGSEGLGYLKEPDDAKGNEKPKHDRG
jgi:hypothetical protein